MKGEGEGRVVGTRSDIEKIPEMPDKYDYALPIEEEKHQSKAVNDRDKQKPWIHFLGGEVNLNLKVIESIEGLAWECWWDMSV